jgi:hypothetical protein
VVALAGVADAAPVALAVVALVAGSATCAAGRDGTRRSM